MSLNKYTLDRFEGDYAIFLKRPDEVEQLLIHRFDIDVELEQGAIVEITDTGEGYHFYVLHEEKQQAENRIKALMEKLKKK
ncbi:DUF3006 domain-containing protein [Lysinibacillus sp. KU-BSD001]|uniref:DUF3006 domain-containing protein n=1 Tax=Lysinibacillus sp. KU-BSD001 TaxID=3141328 RepID=UPI0036E23DBD